MVRFWFGLVLFCFALVWFVSGFCNVLVLVVVLWVGLVFGVGLVWLGWLDWLGLVWFWYGVVSIRFRLVRFGFWFWHGLALVWRGCGLLWLPMGPWGHPTLPQCVFVLFVCWSCHHGYAGSSPRAFGGREPTGPAPPTDDRGQHYSAKRVCWELPAPPADIREPRCSNKAGLLGAPPHLQPTSGDSSIQLNRATSKPTTNPKPSSLWSWCI